LKGAKMAKPAIGNRPYPKNRRTSGGNTALTNPGPIKINYNPMPAQRRFHALDKKYRLYSGAVRAGKSVAGAIEAIKLSMKFPGNVGFIGRKDFTSLRDTTMQTFFKLCPVKLIRYYNKSEHRIEFVNGSIIYFRDLKEPDKLKSMELGWFWIDEGTEVDEEAFVILQSRLSLQGVKHYGWVTTNPDSFTNWVYRFFYEHPDETKGIIETNTYEMKENLPEGYIESLELTYSQHNIDRLLNGKWGFFEGLIYKEFIPKKHIISAPELPRKEHFKEFWASIDWGYKHMTVLLVYGITYDGTVYVLYEVAEALKEIDFWFQKAIEFKRLHTIQYIYCDPARPEYVNKFNMIGGVRGRREIIEGIDCVASWFKRDKLFVSDRCVELIKELQSYKWNSQKIKEEPIGKDDDAVDSLRYGMFSKFGLDEGMRIVTPISKPFLW
jgi:PBSX family phage terminase large subunit